MTQPQLSIVLPLFNEVENLNALYEVLKPVVDDLSNGSYEILFVDDGSRDGSFDLVKALHLKNSKVKGISFARNFGHQTALLAGLQQAKGDLVVTMDADLQHPPEVIKVLYQKYQEGFDIVNTRRLDVEGVSWFKKVSSKYYYIFLNYLSDIPIEPAAADFRLMNRKAVEAYLSLPERSRFTRGLISWMGFRQAIVDYKAHARFAGQSKYSLIKMLRFGLDGIVSFSSRPLRLSFYVGLIAFILGAIYAGFAIIQFFQGKNVPGWTSIQVTLLIIGGTLLLSMGIIGEYVARIFNEVKRRPHYFIKETIGQ